MWVASLLFVRPTLNPITVGLSDRENPYNSFDNYNVCIDLYFRKGGFVESDHLNGDVDMFAVIKLLLEEKRARQDKGEANGEY